MKRYSLKFNFLELNLMYVALNQNKELSYFVSRKVSSLIVSRETLSLEEHQIETVLGPLRYILESLFQAMVVRE